MNEPDLIGVHGHLPAINEHTPCEFASFFGAPGGGKDRFVEGGVFTRVIRRTGQGPLGRAFGI